MADKKQISLRVNGVAHTDEVEPRLLLVHYIREVLGLTGTHVGCETSVCGACTVMLNGEAVKSCTVLAVQADGGDVLTIEGLAKGEELHPLQEGFLGMPRASVWLLYARDDSFCLPATSPPAQS